MFNPSFKSEIYSPVDPVVWYISPSHTGLRQFDTWNLLPTYSIIIWAICTWGGRKLRFAYWFDGRSAWWRCCGLSRLHRSLIGYCYLSVGQYTYQQTSSSRLKATGTPHFTTHGSQCDSARVSCSTRSLVCSGVIDRITVLRLQTM
jgi:hypothetical protein